MPPKEVPFSRIRSPAVPADVRLRARQRIAECVGLVNAKLGISLPMPTCSFDLRGRSAGQAWPQKNHVRFNAVLLVENEAYFMASTIPHEVAHLAAPMKWGFRIRPHGPEWQHTMRALGATPSRTHQLDVRNAAVGLVMDFRCACRARVTLYGKQARLAKAGQAYCKRCKHDLLPVLATKAQPGVALVPDSQSRVDKPAMPTVPQLAYARDLARKLRIEIPAEALASRETMSLWIGCHAVAARGHVAKG